MSEILSVSPYGVSETDSRNVKLDILDPLALFCSVGAQSTSILWGRQKLKIAALLPECVAY